MTYALANSKEYEDLFVHVVEKREDGVVIKGASEE